MNRRKFFRSGSLAALGATLVSPLSTIASETESIHNKENQKAKNIIFMVSDGMSSGTLNMTDIFLKRRDGRSSNWIKLYEDNRVTRALMETASASSIVTDSAAASSSWGGGVRVPNGSLNIGANGEEYLPIWQKFKMAGKMAGCVTSVAITHATPAGFCVSSKSRNSMEPIAQQYLSLDFDVMLGSGNQYFAADKRKDKVDMYAAFKAKGWQIAKTRSELLATSPTQKILGIFGEDSIPYYIDRNSDEKLKTEYPSLAEMTKKAIDRMKSHKNGFVLQVESGKVDWAAHANDVGGLIHEQLAFDEAIKVAIEFAEKDKETLVVITTDHGNANPGIIYGKNADKNFDRIQQYQKTNEWILNSITQNSTVAQIREIIDYANGGTISEEDAKIVLSYYDGLNKTEDGLYNYRKLPFHAFSEMQKKTNSVGWISMDHSADHVELAMFGPGSHLLKPFIKNTDLHFLLLLAAEVENKF